MMKRIISILIWALPVYAGLYAQDEPTPEIHTKEEIKEEKKLLDFKDAFYDAVVYRSIEDYHKALEKLSVCEQIDPDSPAVLYQMAKNYFSLKNYADARIYCDRALEQKPEDFRILDLSADIYEKTHDRDQAIALRKKLYAIHPQEAGKLLQLYYIYNRKEEGRKLLEEVDKNGIYVLNGKFYHRVFSNNTVKQTPKKQSADTPAVSGKAGKFERKLNELEKLAKNKDYTALLSVAESALELYPAQPEMYYYKGLALNGLKRYKEAETTMLDGMDFLLDDKAFNAKYYRLLAGIYDKTGKKKKASAIRKLIKN